MKDMELFERNNPVPSSKMMTFFRNETFTLQAKYTTPTLLPPNAELSVGSFDIGPVPPPKEAEKTKLKVKVRLNLNGLVSVESAQAVEEIEEEVEVKPPPAPAAAEKPTGEAGEAMETDAAEPAEPAAPVFEMRKRIIRTDVPVKSTVGGLPSAVLEQFVAEEYEMALQDRVMEETKERKNAVEEYVYSMRSKVTDALSAFVDPATAENFGKLLNDTEDWLYEDGEDETKGVYVAKLDELKKIGDPIELRAAEESARPAAAAALTSAANNFIAMAATDAAHDHIDAADLAKVAGDAKAALDWLAEKTGMQAALPKTADPALLSSDIVKKREGLERFATPIMNRPKPFIKDDPKPEAPAADAAEPMDAEGGDAPEGAPAADDLD